MLGKTIQTRMRFDTWNLLLLKALGLKNKGTEQGLTLLESLMAILVVTVTISAITAPIFLSAATRVQNRRADQSKQLAQAAVDRVRRLVERGSYTTDELNRLVPEVVGNDILNADVPAKPEQLVDINGDGEKDFRVQVFRSTGVSDLNNRAVAFNLGVRVYVYFNDSQTLEKSRASLTMTTATGSQLRRPLAVLYTDVAVSDNRDSRGNYCKYLNNGTSCS